MEEMTMQEEMQREEAEMESAQEMETAQAVEQPEDEPAMEEMQDVLADVRELLDERINRALDDMGFENLTPIQQQAIPALLQGKDIIGQAQTGTGKTAAFGIPLVQKVDPNLQKLQAIVLCPTRELAIQAALELRKLAKYISGLKVLPVYGGQDISRQIKALPGVQIIVGTPGRVMDHMRRHTVKLEHVNMVVLDEADEMLNMGFREDMELILGEIPGEHQTALFSATMPKPILEITGRFQKDAEHVKVAAQELTVPLVSQKYFLIKNADKDAATVRLLEYYQPKLCLIFCNTKAKVDELAEVLKKKDFQAEGLHGDLIQHQRDVVMNRFRNGSTNILIATDVAARGIDVDNVEIVINYDIPQDIEYYVHRIGRTGRAGKTGQSFTFANARELHRIREIERFCKTTVEEKKLPDPSKVLRSKANRYMESAWELREHEDIDLMKVYLRRMMEKEEMDIMDLAACMLKLQVGDRGEDILEDIPVRRDSRGRGGFGGRDGRGGRGGFGGRDSRGRGGFGGRRDRDDRGFGRRDRDQEEGREGRENGRRDSGEWEGRRDRGERGFGGRRDRDDRGFGGRRDRDDRGFGGRRDHEDRSFGRREERGAGSRRDSEERRENHDSGKFFEQVKAVAEESFTKKRREKKADDRKSGDSEGRAVDRHLAKKEKKSGAGKYEARNVKDVDNYGRPRKFGKNNQ